MLHTVFFLHNTPNTKCFVKPLWLSTQMLHNVHIIVIFGRRMLNKCPLDDSCGAASSYWTDGVAPAVVGVPANITAYLSTSFNGRDAGCKYQDRDIQLLVMRCSEHDVIYKYTPSGIGHAVYHDICAQSFCGMM